MWNNVDLDDLANRGIYIILVTKPSLKASNMADTYGNSVHSVESVSTLALMACRGTSSWSGLAGFFGDILTCGMDL